MQKPVATLLIALVGLTAHPSVAHEPNQSGSPLPWTDAGFRDDPDNFQFAIVTDRTGGARMGVFQEGLRKVNMLQPEFVMSVGDLIGGYTDETDQIVKEWEEFDNFLELLEMRFYFVPGNHDITNETMAAEWERQLGASYYHFVYKDVLFLCLNTEDQEPSTISESQVEYARAVLRDHPDVRWTLVFMHKPLWVYDNPTGWASIEEALAGRRHTVFAGHFHTYTKHHRNDESYIVLATTGGGSSLAGPAFGSFDHFVWVTVTDEGPRIGNLLLDGVLDADVRTTETAELTDPFIRGGAVGLTPVFVEETDFRQAATWLVLTNEADQTLSFSARFDAHEQLRLRPVSLASEIEPQGTAQFEILVTAYEEVAVDSLDPVALHWKARYDSVTMEHSSELAFQRYHDLKRRNGEVKIDGILDEWDELPFSNAPSGRDGWSPAEVSFRFETVYDNVLAEPIPNPWYQDCIMVLIDAREDPTRSTSRARNASEVMAHLTLSPTGDPDVNVRWHEEDLRNWAATHGRLTEKGFAAEFALPISYLVERQGEEWSAIRLNIGVQDHDSDGSSMSVTFSPYWHFRGDVPGSGTFKRR